MTSTSEENSNDGLIMCETSASWRIGSLVLIRIRITSEGRQDGGREIIRFR